METLVWQCELCPAGLTEAGEGLQGQRLRGRKGWNTVLPEVWESLGTAHLSTASDLCPVFPVVKQSLICFLSPKLLSPVSDVANPMAGKALGGGDSPRLRGPWGSRREGGHCHPQPPGAHCSWDSRPPAARGAIAAAGSPPRSRSGGGGQELERNHVRRLPPSLGPGGPGRQLGRRGEPGRPSRAAEAVLRGRSRNSLELPP